MLACVVLLCGSAADFAGLCQDLGADPAQGLTLAQFTAMYPLRLFAVACLSD
eukprot:COSAG05_NODE_57_length_23291_cov_75.862668_37_plen_52_part_00